ncbi:MAG: acetate kinase [Oscillospiraceae bacterium]|nr:acetate kinase [Oscillospiraceae bacterium]
MNVLVINSGSSSLKFQLMDTAENKVSAKGICERVGVDGVFTYTGGNTQFKDKPMDIPGHEDAIKIVIATLTDAETGVIKSLDCIGAVGHRVVNGSEKHTGSALLDDKEIEYLGTITKLAPLHSPAILRGIKACKKIMPGIPQVGVFDTSFHATIPDYSYIYPLPYEIYSEKKIRRYGFHGTSHNYVTGEAAKFLGRDIKDLKIVSCHLGSGSSITAVDGGRSVDTTMGFTPLEGLMMGTRCGTIDPAIVTYLINEEGMDPKEVEDMMNKRSGLIGVSGVSNDWRDVCDAAKQGDKRAILAQKMLSTQIKKYIGAYAAVMGGINVLLFTAGMGENSYELRKLVCTGMEYLGIKIDDRKNQNFERGANLNLSAPGSAVQTLIIPTDEEYMIARETVRTIAV